MTLRQTSFTSGEAFLILMLCSHLQRQTVAYHPPSTTTCIAASKATSSTTSHVPANHNTGPCLPSPHTLPPGPMLHPPSSSDPACRSGTTTRTPPAVAHRSAQAPRDLAVLVQALYPTVYCTSARSAHSCSPADMRTAQRLAASTPRPAR